MENLVLDVKNLVTEFKTEEGRVKAVNDVSFKVKKGKILGIVGESGCGKSVTSLSIMRLLSEKSSIISGGEVLFQDKNLLNLSNKEMRSIRGNEIAMIFQEPMTALNPVFTIGFQIGEVLELHKGLKGKKNKEKCIELLKRVGIPRAEYVLDEYPHQLSGGMRQRVMIAMALACNPKLLIADEPTTALDVTIQAQVLEIMKSLVDEYGMSVIFITHDLGVIAEVAEDVVVMYSGKVIEETSVQEIFNNPMHCYTEGLMNSRAAIAKKGERLNCINGMVPSLNNMPKGCAFEPRCKKAMSICKERMPELLEVKDGHKVRCWAVEVEKGDEHGR